MFESSELMTKNFTGYVYYGLMISGLIILLITLPLKTKGAIAGTIVGYSFLTVGSVILFGYFLFNVKLTKSTLFTYFPLIVFLGLLIFVIYIISYYFDIISTGHIAKSYYNLMGAFNACLFCLTVLFYYAIEDPEFKKTHKMDLNKTLGICFFETLSFILLISTDNVLKYFTTNG